MSGSRIHPSAAPEECWHRQPQTERPVQLPDDDQVRFATQCEIEKPTPLAPAPQVIGPGLVDELAKNRDAL